MSDPRPTHTRNKLGDALIELLREKPFDAIRVQDVLDRAQIGRSTFYEHYKDKRDLLVSDYEEFLQLFAAADPGTGRVFIVAELYAHVQQNLDLWDKLAAAGVLPDFLALAEGIFARSIERRLPEAAPHRAMKARALAAALLSLLRNWKETPEALDVFFHQLV